ncbi:MAG: lipid A biosynthesis acyltransferase [Alphaproteobacteria bacterium]|nr:lipid A biosynthesis acyltransferase [Alphaproteobacteria bacterium]NCQ87745.1 lipid A biosynthesis acyltransferase [Alphaproteobacteria bacterium]NCT05747.1 lipid A biosynthesis acyltransferase [Alphaproteobacteria bacterium]
MKNARYTLEALFILILFGLFKVMPASWASAIGGFFGRAIGPHLAASRKALRNIQNALPEENHQDILIGMWDNLGRTFAEYPHLKTLAKNHTQLVGVEHLQASKDSASIIFAAHLGNWEICPLAAALQENYITHSIYRAPNNPLADKLLMKCRNLGGLLQPIPKSKSGTRQIVKRLSNKEHLGFLIDQKYNEGVPVDFFHAPAMTSPAYIQLAQKFDCPLIPAQIERVKGASFKVTIHPPLRTKGVSEAELFAQTHHLLEDWIKQRPAQWLWLHRRWDSAQLKD